MKRGNVIAAVIVLFSLLTIPLGIYLITREKDVGTSARAKGGEGVFVYFSPSEVRISQGGLVEVDLKIDTGNDIVGGFEGILQYDPRYLRLSSETRTGGAFLDLTSDEDLGVITLRGDGRVSGEGRIATFDFSTSNRGISSITLDKVSVWDMQKENNLFSGSVESVNVSVN